MNKVIGLYTAASGLANDKVETQKGYGKAETALNARQQSILRKCGHFIKPATSKADSKPAKDKAASCARSSATNAPKKKSRGRGRKTQGLPPHPTHPPLSPNSKNANSTPVPAEQPVCLGGVDARP